MVSRFIVVLAPALVLGTLAWCLPHSLFGQVSASEVGQNGNEPEAEKAVRKAIVQTVSIDFRARPFSEALRELERFLAIEIRLDRQALAAAHFDLAAPVTFRVSGISAESALNLLLRSKGLAWTVDGQAILVTTPKEERRRTVSRDYDVSDLADLKILPCRDDDETKTATLADAFRRIVGAQGSIAIDAADAHRSLKATQPWRTHREIEAVLRELRQARESVKREPNSAPVKTCVPEWEQKIRRALGETVRIDFQDVPLEEVARQLEVRLKTPVQLDRNALEEVGVHPDTKVRFKVSEISAAAALDVLLVRSGLSWCLRDEVLLITTPDEAGNHLATRIYDVRDLTGQTDQSGRVAYHSRLLARQIESLEATTWDTVGGPGSLVEVEGEGFAIYVVSQTGRVLSEIDALFNKLRTIRAAGRGQNKFAPIQDEPPQWEQKIRRALERKISVEVSDAPFEKVIRGIQEQLGIEIQLDYKALAEVGFDPQKSVTMSKKNIPASDCLRRIMRAVGLTWMLWREVLLITTPYEAAIQLECRFYDVRDFAPTHCRPETIRDDLDDLTDLITASIQPTTWDPVGGPGSIDAFCAEGLVVLPVCQTEEVHAEIQSLLGQLRRLRNATTLSVQGVPVSPQSHDAEGKAMRALETKIDIDVRGKPLAETLAVFRGQLNIRFISERKSLEEIGFDSAEPMTVRASGIAASSAIETLCRLNGFAWMIVDGGVVITSHDDVSNSLRMKFYDVRDFAPPRRAPVARDFESLIRAITTYIEPKTWDEFGGPGSIAPYVSNGITALVISQTWQVHDKVAALLAQLRAIRQSGRAATGKAFAAPVVSAWEKRIREALTRPVPLGFAGKPLSEVIAALRDFLRAEIQLDSRALAEARVASDPRITVDQPGISARSLLDAIVTPHKLAWTVRDETIWITTPAEECDHFLVSWVYDVAGLAGAGKQADFERLIGRITHAVAPDSWEHRGGNGSADPFVAHGITALLVSQTWRNQCKIEELLSAIAKEPALTEPLKR